VAAFLLGVGRVGGGGLLLGLIFFSGVVGITIRLFIIFYRSVNILMQQFFEFVFGAIRAPLLIFFLVLVFLLLRPILILPIIEHPHQLLSKHLFLLHWRLPIELDLIEQVLIGVDGGLSVEALEFADGGL
jgi:hypothetical protein